jgi:hypothetical protein
VKRIFDSFLKERIGVIPIESVVLWTKLTIFMIAYPEKSSSHITNTDYFKEAVRFINTYSQREKVCKYSIQATIFWVSEEIEYLLPLEILIT